ncbi:hypothetical protein ACLIBG_10540 [Virgibacillus sp. W0181]
MHMEKGVFNKGEVIDPHDSFFNDYKGANGSRTDYLELQIIYKQ